jgi:hypothetical protein
MSGAGGALLAQVAGGLLAEHGVLGSQAAVFSAGRVQEGAERFRGGALGVVAERGGAERMRVIRSRMPGLR